MSAAMTTTTNPGALTAMRHAANLAATTAERLRAKVSPGHCNYVSKEGAAANCERICAEIEEARATVEQMAGALQRAVEAAEARMPNASFLSDARAALAAFRGEA